MYECSKKLEAVPVSQYCVLNANHPRYAGAGTGVCACACVCVCVCACAYACAGIDVGSCAGACKGVCLSLTWTFKSQLLPLKTERHRLIRLERGVR